MKFCFQDRPPLAGWLAGWSVNSLTPSYAVHINKQPCHSLFATRQSRPGATLVQCLLWGASGCHPNTYMLRPLNIPLSTSPIYHPFLAAPPSPVSRLSHDLRAVTSSSFSPPPFFFFLACFFLLAGDAECHQLLSASRLPRGSGVLVYLHTYICTYLPKVVCVRTP